MEEVEAKMIIIEGMDGSGKTSLAQKLSFRLGDVPIKRLVTSGGPTYYDLLVERTRATLTELRNQVTRNQRPVVIYDRFPLISEAVYGTILRGRNSFGDEWTTLIDLLLALDPVVIYCRPRIDLILQNIRETADDQMDGVVSKALELITAYDELISWLQVKANRLRSGRILVYDYDLDEVKDVEAEIRRIYQKQGVTKGVTIRG
mgnify:CR=1 FL=1